MARIRQEDIDAVKERTDVVQLVGNYLTLKKSGHDSLSGLCPFHQEKTPSSSVSPSKQVFYCFGCGKGGDAITFLRELEHLSYVEAIERLAQTAGVHLRYEGDSLAERRAAERRAALYRANEEAAALYQTMLTGGREADDARAYVTERGIIADAVQRFGIGYAPGYSDFLYFSFVIGMTFQVADVAITAKGLRRVALAQGVLAFFFNVIVLAFTVNILAGMI